MPGTNLSANRIIITFITNRKSPNVISVRGRVSKTRRGFTIALSIARTNAKIIAVVKESIVTCCFNRIDNTYTTTAVIRILIINFIMISLIKSKYSYL
jgi:hypothetical protein